jgi:hypothetical protein
MFYRGDEYLSSGLAATLLGVSGRTVKRYVKAGLLASADIPRGIKGQHWFLPGDVEQLARLRAEGVTAPRDGKQARQLPFSSYARAGRRAVRTGDDWESPAEQRDGPVDTPGVVEPALQPVEPLLCPACGAELLTISAGVRGARADLNQILFCESCLQIVDLSAPKERYDNTCPACGEEVTWEVPCDGQAGWQGRCDEHGVVVFSDQHGVVEGHRKKKVEEQLFRHTGVFPPVPAAVTARPRGLTQADVAYAIRQPPPAPKPPTSTWLPPWELGH